MTGPQPGIYEGVSFDDYLSWDYMNASAIRQGLRSMAHLKAFLDNREGLDTPALSFGKFIHTSKLEPLEIAKRYAVMPEFHLDAENITAKNVRTESKATTYYRGKVAEFEAANRDKEIITEAQYEQMLGMIKTLGAHRRAVQYLCCPGPTELCIVWDDPKTGIRCKARIDKHDPHNSLVIDLKTSRDVGRFERAIANYGYAEQGAFYMDGMTLATGICHHFAIVAVETEPPYGVRAAPLGVASFTRGREVYQQVLADYKRAMGCDEWPCYDDPETWELPEWAMGEDTGTELQINGQTITV